MFCDEGYSSWSTKFWCKRGCDGRAYLVDVLLDDLLALVGDPGVDKARVSIKSTSRTHLARFMFGLPSVISEASAPAPTHPAQARREEADTRPWSRHQNRACGSGAARRRHRSANRTGYREGRAWGESGETTYAHLLECLCTGWSRAAAMSLSASTCRPRAMVGGVVSERCVRRQRGFLCKERSVRSATTSPRRGTFHQHKPAILGPIMTVLGLRGCDQPTAPVNANRTLGEHRRYASELGYGDDSYAQAVYAC